MRYYEVKMATDRKFVGMVFILNTRHKTITFPGLEKDVMTYNQCKYHGNTIRINNEDSVWIGLEVDSI